MVENLQLGSEFARSTTFLALTTSIASPVTTLTITTVTPVTVTTATTTESPLTALLTHHSTWGNVRSLLLDVGSRDNLSREMEPLAQIVETLGSELQNSLVFPSCVPSKCPQLSMHTV